MASEQHPASLNMVELEPGQRLRMSSSKSTKGWDNLPVNVLQMILSYALSWTPSPLASLPNWQRLPHGINFAIVELNHRSALARFRLVSKSWTAAVDSHEFWRRHSYVLGGPVTLVAHEQHSSRSTANSPSAFLIAAITAKHLCTICYVNHCMPRPSITLVSTHFGRISVCEGHLDFCNHCLVAGPSLDEVAWPLLADAYGDTDEHGRKLQHNSALCQVCRSRSLFSALSIEVRDTAYDLGTWERDTKVAMYESRGIGTAESIARYVVAVRWLKERVPYDALAHLAARARDNEVKVKLEFMRKARREDSFERRTRKELLAELWDKSVDDETDEESEMDGLYDDWNEEKALRYESDGEDDGWELDYEAADVLLDPRVQMRHENRLLGACIRHFINARIRSGWWVSPRDELHSVLQQSSGDYRLSAEVPYTPLEFSRACDPIQDSTEPDSFPIDNIGIISGSAALPSRYLIGELENDYVYRFKSILLLPLAEIVEFIDSLRISQQSKSDMGRQMTVEKLLDFLRTRECWHVDGLQEGGKGREENGKQLETPTSIPRDHDMGLSLDDSSPSAAFPVAPCVSLKRSPSATADAEPDVKRRKSSHDSSSSSADTMRQSASNPSTAPSSIMSLDLEPSTVDQDDVDPVSKLASIMDYVPYIPAKGVKIGPTAEMVMLSAWQQASQKLHECGCQICARRDRFDDLQRQMDEALGEEDFLIYENDCE